MIIRMVIRSLLALLLWLTSMPLIGSEFKINSPIISREQDAYLLDAYVDYELSQPALEALSNGVQLTLVVQINLEKLWNYPWDKDVIEHQLRYSIRYRALTGLYEVIDEQSGDKRHFVTQDAALRALGEIRQIELAGKSTLDRELQYLLRMRAQLDIEALPLPIRPLAYLDKGWTLSSGWKQWPLKP